MPVKNCFLYQDLVSVIPCLAKADSFTSEEVADLKLEVSINEQKCRLSHCLKELISVFQIKQQLKQNKIHFYNFSNAEIISKLPFSLIGSNTAVITEDGKCFKGRKYPWGIVNVENEVK